MPYVIVGVGIGAVIHNWIPKEWIVKVLGTENPFGVIIAAICGIPMYADIFGCKERIAELDGLMHSVYEDKVSGEISASMCTKLLSKYEAEQNALSAEVQEIEARQLM